MIDKENVLWMQITNNGKLIETVRVSTDNLFLALGTWNELKIIMKKLEMK